MILYFILSFLLQDPIETLLDKGFSEYTNGEYIEALHTFKQAEQLDPQNPEIFFLTGISQFGLKNIEESVEYLEKAITLDPQYLEAYQELGYIFLVTRAPQRAISAYDKAIQLDPEGAELYVNRGTAKCMLNDTAGADADWAIAKKLGVDYGPMMTCE